MENTNTNVDNINVSSIDTAVPSVQNTVGNTLSTAQATTEELDLGVEKIVVKTGIIQPSSINFSRIATNANDAKNGNFTSKGEEYEQLLQGEITYNVRDDGSVQIIKNNMVIAYTDMLGISELATGPIHPGSIDFSRITTNANDAINGNFLDEDRILTQYWNGNLTYKRREDGSIQIIKDGVVMGYTDERGINIQGDKFEGSANAENSTGGAAGSTVNSESTGSQESNTTSSSTNTGNSTQSNTYKSASALHEKQQHSESNTGSSTNTSGVTHTGYLDLSRIATDENEAINGNFMTGIPDKWKTAEFEFVEMENGSFKILDDVGTVMGYTDKKGIIEQSNIASSPADPNVTTGESVSSTQYKELVAQYDNLDLTNLGTKYMNQNLQNPGITPAQGNFPDVTQLTAEDFNITNFNKN